MANMTFGGNNEEKKKFQTNVPAEDGYSFNLGAVPNKVTVGATQTKPVNTPVNNAPENNAPANTQSGANKVTVSNQNTEKWPVVTVGGGSKQTFSTPSSGTVSQNPSGTVGGTVTAPEKTAEENAKTSIADLMDRYSSEIREDYDYSAKKMKEERDEALRENWILQQQAQAALPEQLAAAGINGGARETSLADLVAKYQGNRNDIQKEYMDNLGDLNQNTAQNQAEVVKGYNDRWLEYLLSLAEAEKEHEYNKDLLKYK